VIGRDQMKTDIHQTRAADGREEDEGRLCRTRWWSG
jgi:hypothetical protein